MGQSCFTPGTNNACELQDKCSLGIIRLDYNYPAHVGDIDHPGSYGYDVYFAVVPGLTFAMCMAGKMTDEVEGEFKDAIHRLEAKGVSAITGDCGFMMNFQKLACIHARVPCFMSALCQLPAIACCFEPTEQIIIMTANETTLAPMIPTIKATCGIDTTDNKFHIVGCQDVPGFEAVAEGKKVDVEKCTPGIVAKAKAALKKFPQTRCILLECTELPPYADSLRKETGLAVYDAITNADFFIMGFQDNKRFGIDFQKDWDHVQDDYELGQDLDKSKLKKLINK